jgi:hypothetical protein
MTGTTINSGIRSASISPPRKIAAVMAAALGLSAFVAFGPFSAPDAAAVGQIEAEVDYGIRHLGELARLPAASRLVDYGLRHLEPSRDLARSPDFALRHLGE